MKIVLLRVGTDSGCRPIQANGPLLPDGSFELVPIPDHLARDERRTYGNTVGRSGRLLADYFPQRRSQLAGQPMHVDPEFETWTYGTPTRLQSRLATLDTGDMLVFYGGLRPVTEAGVPLPGSRPTCYLFGYFQVACAVRGRDHGREALLPCFGANFHVRHADLFRVQQDRLVLVKGGPGSRLLQRARQISGVGRDARGKPIQVLSEEMREILGPFTGIGSIQRCTPRWVRSEYVDDAARFLRSLP